MNIFNDQLLLKITKQTCSATASLRSLGCSVTKWFLKGKGDLWSVLAIFNNSLTTRKG